MQLHNDRDKRLQPTRRSQIDTPPANAEFVMHRRGTPVPRLTKRLQRPEMRLPDAGTVGDSPMITMCYEAHLSMQKMLAAFAELRGDDAADAVG